MAVVPSSHVLVQSFVTLKVGSECTDIHTQCIHLYLYCMNTNMCTTAAGNLAKFVLQMIIINYNRE